MRDERTSQSTISSHQYLVAELSRFSTFEELRHSQFYKLHRAEIKRLLDEPRVYRCESPRPRLRSFLRVVEWNIERGSRLDGIIEVLNNHPVLKFADLLLISELDEGMLRSGNINVALELGRALSADVVFGVEYIELTKGTGDELMLIGENTAALHGNAILSRHALANPQVTRLPRCQNNFEGEEKRIGGRIGITVEVEIAGKQFIVGNTHLDVVSTPRCRAKQMRAMLQSMEARLEKERARDRAVIVGGDLNTHTFARATRFQAIKNTVTILAGSRDALNRRLIHPETKEAALRELARFSYQTESFNDRSATSRTIVSNLDDRSRLPRPMKWWVNRRVGPEGLLLEFRLDWLAARGMTALKAGEVVDEMTGIASVDAQTFLNLEHNESPLSDHDPIVVDVAL